MRRRDAEEVTIMFPHPITLCHFADLRAQDLQREAAQERLADQAQAGRRSLPSLASLQNLLGTALVWTGERLQGAPRVLPAAQAR
jgi:hypothetical protein